MNNYPGVCSRTLAVRASHTGTTHDGLLNGRDVYLTLDSLAGHAEGSDSWHTLEIDPLSAGSEGRVGFRSA